MKKTTKELEDKSIAVLEKESYDLRREIASMGLELKANPQKDTNALTKKKRKLAVLLTILNEKKNKELVKQSIK